MTNPGHFGQPGRNVYISPGRPPKERSVSAALENSFKGVRGDASRIAVIAERVTRALETGWMEYDLPPGINIGDLTPKDNEGEDDKKKKKQLPMRIQAVDADTYAVFLGPDSWMDLFKFVVNHTDGPVRVENEIGDGMVINWNLQLVQIPQEMLKQIPDSGTVMLPENALRDPSQ
jgi:hypothetical protein